MDLMTKENTNRELLKYSLEFYRDEEKPLARYHSLTKDNRCTCGNALCKNPGNHLMADDYNFAEVIDFNEMINTFYSIIPNIALILGVISKMIAIEIKNTKEGKEAFEKFSKKYNLPIETSFVYSKDRTIYLYSYNPEIHIPKEITDMDYPDLIIHGDGSCVPTMPSRIIEQDNLLLLNDVYINDNLKKLPPEFYRYIEEHKNKNRIFRINEIDNDLKLLIIYLLKLACHLRKNKYSEVEIKSLLEQINSKFKNKVPDELLDKILYVCSKNVVKKIKEFKLRLLHFDLELIKMMEKESNGKLFYLTGFKKCIVWDGFKWVIDEKEEALIKIHKKIIKKAIKKLSEITDPDDFKWFSKTITGLQNGIKIKNIIELFKLSTKLKRKIEDFDKNKFQINLQNYTLDFQIIDFYPNFKNDLHSKIANVDFDVDAQCPKWLKFLYEITCGSIGLIKLLQKMAGYCLIESNRLHLMFILQGFGDNGKSIFLNTLKVILGDYAMTSSLNHFKQNATQKNGLAKLKGARMIILNESSAIENIFIDDNLIKQFTAEDPIEVRFLYQEFFDIIPGGKILISCNRIPGFQLIDAALERRIVPIPFSVVIPKEEKNRNLQDELLEERSGILNWMIRGLKDVLLEGIELPWESKKMLFDYKMNRNNVFSFINDTCNKVEGHMIPSGKFFQFYRNITKKIGDNTPIMQKTFSSRLEEMYLKIKKPNGMFFVGLKLKDPDEISTTFGIDAYLILKEVGLI